MEVKTLVWVYIHGFNGGLGDSGLRIARAIGAEVYCPVYDYARSYGECLAELEARILDLRAPELCLCGVSLGGFYAAQLRLPGVRRVLIWNPVIYPAAQLAPFLGENFRFHDGKRWIFERRALYSYAEAPDPRVWRNSAWQKYRPEAPLSRRVTLGTRDELLDSSLASVYWREAAEVAFIEAGHHVEDFGDPSSWF